MTFVAETDHKPLIAIIKKNLSEMSPQIQRLIMKLQRFDFELIYTPGKYIVLADALFRAPQHCEPHNESSTERDVNLHVNLVSETLPVSDMKSKWIAVETAKDKVLQQVIKYMNTGWPKGLCQQFYHIQAELSVVNGLLLRKSRIVIPQSLRQDMLKRIHKGHLGTEKCKRRTRTAIYWPGMNADIDHMVLNCPTCLKHHDKQPKEPMILADLPAQPWQRVGTDLFHLDGKNYLLVIDLSNYPEIALLPTMTAACVIKHLRSIFARHGIPQIVCSDNGPCFHCKEFQTFAETYDFQHVTISPLYAQSNGKAEKGVHIVKRLLKKAKDSNADPYLAPLSYRASPLEHGMSTAELLMRRKLRTTLPYIAGHKQSRCLKQKQERLMRRQKEYFDKSAQALKPLSRHDTVRIGDTNNWNITATVLDEVSPRSYTVRTEDGQILRRNHRGLLKTQGTLQEQLGERGPETSAKKSSY
uniref:Gypsy retrotransposon integrase-like protein 1 n=1 Tax=Pygocentrus nattereri TaxID=42514 RepID=A0AAR2KRY5_PYGNA